MRYLSTQEVAFVGGGAAASSSIYTEQHFKQWRSMVVGGLLGLPGGPLGVAIGIVGGALVEAPVRTRGS